MSYANSKIPESAQSGVHEGLAERVARHAAAPFRKPYADYNRTALAESLHGWNGRDPVILDAGCGVGIRRFSWRAKTRALGHRRRSVGRPPGAQEALSRGLAAHQHGAGTRRSGGLLAVAVRRGCAPRAALHPLSESVAQDRPPRAKVACPPGFSVSAEAGGGSNAAPTGRCILRNSRPPGIVAGMPGEVANIPCRAADFAVRAQIPGLGTDAVPIDDRFRSSFGSGAADPFFPTHGTGND